MGSSPAKLSSLVFLVLGQDGGNPTQFPDLIRVEYTDVSVRAVFPVRHLPGFSHDEQVKTLREAKVIAIVVTDSEDREVVTRQVWPNESHYDKDAKREGVLKLQSLRTIGVSDDSPMELRVHWEVMQATRVINSSGLEIGKAVENQLGVSLTETIAKTGNAWG